MMQDQDIHGLIEGVQKADSAVGLLMAVPSLTLSGHRKFR